MWLLCLVYYNDKVKLALGVKVGVMVNPNFNQFLLKSPRVLNRPSLRLLLDSGPGGNQTRVRGQ